MKKLTTLVLSVFLFASVANAQLRLGIKGGLNTSSLSTTSSIIDQVKTASSYQAGVLLQLKFGGFAIQPEVLYSIKGGDLQNVKTSDVMKLAFGGEANTPTTATLKTQNIDIPLNFQFGMGFGPARVYAQAGPYVSFQLDAALNGDTKLYDTVDKTLEFNKYDWGIGVGAGVEILNLQLSLKYDFGMNEVGKPFSLNSLYPGNLNPFNDMKNRNLNVSLAYLF